MRKTLIALTSTVLMLSGCGAASHPLAAPVAATSYNVKAVADAPFPGLNHVVRVDFGSKWDLHFTSMTQMTYAAPGAPTSQGETVKITVTPIRPNVFMVTWQESDNTAVTHVEDYENHILYTNIATPDGKFYNLKGTLNIVQ